MTITQDNCKALAGLKKELGLAASATTEDAVRKACLDLRKIQKRLHPLLLKP